MNNYQPSSEFNTQAIYTNEGMVVVLKGPKLGYITADNTPEYRQRIIEKCDVLIDKGILQKEGDHCIFTQEYLFPSAAASLLLLGNANGWIEFRTENGVTLSNYQSQNH